MADEDGEGESEPEPEADSPSFDGQLVTGSDGSDKKNRDSDE